MTAGERHATCADLLLPERRLELLPMLEVRSLGLVVLERQALKDEILDEVRCSQWRTSGVESLEDLLRVLVGRKLDDHHLQHHRTEKMRAAYFAGDHHPISLALNVLPQGSPLPLERPHVRALEKRHQQLQGREEHVVRRTDPGLHQCSLVKRTAAVRRTDRISQPGGPRRFTPIPGMRPWDAGCPHNVRVGAAARGAGEGRTGTPRAARLAAQALRVRSATGFFTSRQGPWSVP